MGKIFIARINTYRSNKRFSVNTGVLLLNLLKMRKYEIEKKVLNLLNSGFTDPDYHDQAIINKFYKHDISFLSPEYNKIISSIHEIYKKAGGLYDFDSLYFARKFASILHYPGPPPKIYDDENWYYFARKSKYFRKRSQNYSKIFNFSV